MALGFGTTLGVATTDRVVSASETVPGQFSFHVWTNRNGNGGANLGRIFHRGGSTFVLYNNSTSNYVFGNASTPYWTFTRPAASTWVPIGLSVDTTSSTNDPIIYVSGTKLTVGSGLTQVGADAPYIVSAFQWFLGNSISADRGWDGMLAIPAMWNVILSDAEFALLAAGEDPANIQSANLTHYLPFSDLSGNDTQGAAWTVTGTAVQSNPPGVPSSGGITLDIGNATSNAAASAPSITQTQVLSIDNAQSNAAASDVSVTIGAAVILSIGNASSTPQAADVSVTIASGAINLITDNALSQPTISPQGVSVARNNSLVSKVLAPVCLD